MKSFENFRNECYSQLKEAADRKKPKVHKGFHPPGYDPEHCPACKTYVAQQKKGETLSQLSGGRYASEWHGVKEDEGGGIPANNMSGGAIAGFDPLLKPKVFRRKKPKRM